jgi:hypothetical protein
VKFLPLLILVIQFLPASAIADDELQKYMAAKGVVLETLANVDISEVLDRRFLKNHPRPYFYLSPTPGPRNRFFGVPFTAAKGLRLQVTEVLWNSSERHVVMKVKILDDPGIPTEVAYIHLSAIPNQGTLCGLSRSVFSSTAPACNK